MSKIKKAKLEQFTVLNTMLLEQKSYLNIIKGYCENAMHDSEEIADILLIVEKSCELHEKISDNIDNFVILFGSQSSGYNPVNTG